MKKRDKKRGADIVFWIFLVGISIFAIGMVFGGWKWFRELFTMVVNGG